MIHRLKFLVFMCLIPAYLFSQDTKTSLPDDPLEPPDAAVKRAAADSLTLEENRLMREADKVRARLDSLNSLVGEEYTKKGVIDTIVGVIEKSGTVYQRPDILSGKLFKARKDEIVVIIGFSVEWFRILHEKGEGFILQESIRHDDRIYNYKKIQIEKSRIPEWEE